MGSEKDDARRRELADFLRCRREAAAPERAGVEPGPRRRTPGLRREEVASLAGISTTYYTWMEQARALHPSPEALAGVARALMLDAEGTAHLFELAGQAAPDDAASDEATVSPALQRLLDRQGTACALVQDRRWNVLAWNEAARLVLFDFPAIAPTARNYVRLALTDRGYRTRLRNWNEQVRGLVARFRAEADAYADDPWLLRFVDELCAESPGFARLWGLHEVAAERSRIKVLDDPRVGRLSFEHTVLDVAGGGGLRLFVNAPLPGTDTEERMRALLAEEARS